MTRLTWIAAIVAALAACNPYVPPAASERVDAGSGEPDADRGDDVELVAEPAALDFGQLTAGESSAPRRVTVRNPGAAAAAALAPAIEGAGFTIVADTCVDVSLDPGGPSCHVDVVFAPAATAEGPQVATLVSGALEVALDGEAVAPGDLQISTTAGFGPVAIGATGSLEVEVENIGGTTSAAIAVELTGATGPFTITANGCTTLAPQAICQVTVELAPDSVGPLSATLRVSAGDQLALHGLGGTGTARVSVTVSGSGTVTSNPEGIACSVGTCSAAFDVVDVELEAEPGANASLTGWTGGGCSAGASCALTLAGDVELAASFALIQHGVAVTVYGPGRVRSQTMGIDCGSVCTATYAQGTTVTLDATALAGSQFERWGGDCTGVASDHCQIAISAARNVTAYFRVPLTVTRTGAAAALGHVGGSGMDCGASCTRLYDYGASIALLASVPGGNAWFTGWSGGGCGAGNGCAFSLTTPTTVSAAFVPNRTLTVHSDGVNAVSVAPGGVCTDTCSYGYPDGQVVTLTAVPAADDVLADWLGDCGSGTCTMTANRDVTARWCPAGDFCCLHPGGPGCDDPCPNPHIPECNAF